MVNLLTALLVGTLTGFFRLHWDLNTSFHDKKTFKHWKRNLVILIPCSISLWEFALFLQLPLELSLVVSTIMFCGNWLYWFSGVFNQKRGYPWFFTGNMEGKDAAWTDEMLEQLTYAQRKVLVTGLMVIPNMIYVILKIYSYCR